MNCQQSNRVSLILTYERELPQIYIKFWERWSDEIFCIWEVNKRLTSHTGWLSKVVTLKHSDYGGVTGGKWMVEILST